MIESNEYRKVLGKYPTGVTLVTSPSSEGPLGMVIGSFVSVSIEPKLVLFCINKDNFLKMSNF